MDRVGPVVRAAPVLVGQVAPAAVVAVTTVVPVDRAVLAAARVREVLVGPAVVAVTTVVPVDRVVRVVPVVRAVVMVHVRVDRADRVRVVPVGRAAPVVMVHVQVDRVALPDRQDLHVQAVRRRTRRQRAPIVPIAKKRGRRLNARPKARSAKPERRPVRRVRVTTTIWNS